MISYRTIHLHFTWDTLQPILRQLNKSILLSSVSPLFCLSTSGHAATLDKAAFKIVCILRILPSPAPATYLSDRSAITPRRKSEIVSGF